MRLYATLNGLPSACARSAHSVAAVGSRFTSTRPQLTESLPASHLLFQSMASPNIEATVVPMELSRPVTRRAERTTTTQIAINDTKPYQIGLGRDRLSLLQSNWDSSLIGLVRFIVFNGRPQQLHRFSSTRIDSERPKGRKMNTPVGFGPIRSKNWSAQRPIARAAEPLFISSKSYAARRSARRSLTLPATR